MKRFELSTLSLARRCSTTELHPHGRHRRQTNHAPQTFPRSNELTLKQSWQHEWVSDPRRAKTCGLVVGMHNSGTSLLAALLNAAAVPMGGRLLMRHSITASQRPTYDYFEDKDVVELQDAHLLRIQRHWSSFRASFPLPHRDTPERVVFRGELRELVRKRFRWQSLWVVKDPRIGALLPDWLEVLDGLGISPRLLIVHRDPAPNIRSFSRKGQVPPLWSEALWQRTYINAVTAAVGRPADCVYLASFQDLISSPQREAERACSFLDWKPPGDIQQRISSRFDPSLPTEHKKDNRPKVLHPATHELAKILNGALTKSTTLTEERLLASSMATALQPGEAPLQLNALHRDGQSLLPKLRVTIVTAELQGWSSSGGIGSAYLELASALAGAGHQVRVLLVAASIQQPQERCPLIDVEQLDPTGLGALDLSRAVAKRLQHDPGDVVHLHDWLGLGSGLKNALGHRCPPLLVGLHGPSAWTRSGNPWTRAAAGGLTAPIENIYAEGLIQALEQDVIQQADLLIAPSTYMARWIQDQPNNYATSLAPLVQRNCPLSNCRVNHDGSHKITIPRTLVYFGRLEQRKGLALFLNSLNYLKARPHAVVFLGGDCAMDDGSRASDVARIRIESLGMTCRFLTTLQRSEALATIQNLKGVVAIPSIIENSPCVVEELLDSGLRVVTTNVGGTPELVTAGCEAWLSEPEPEAFAHHLHQALTTPRPDAYLLKARVPGWQIALSWQAFHERFPRRAADETQCVTTSAPLRRRLRYAKQALGYLLSNAGWRT